MWIKYSPKQAQYLFSLLNSHYPNALLLKWFDVMFCGCFTLILWIKFMCFGRIHYFNVTSYLQIKKKKKYIVIWVRV